MKIPFQQIPLLRLVAPFFIGLIVAIWVPGLLQLPYFGGLLVFSSLLFGLGLAVSYRLNYRLRWVYGGLLSALMFIFGITSVYLHTDSLRPNNVSKLKDGYYQFQAKVLEVSVSEGQSARVLAELLSVGQEGSASLVSGKVILDIALSGEKKPIYYGDQIWAEAFLGSIEAPKNPGEFDYKQYMAYQQVYKQARLGTANWHKTGENLGNPIFAKVYSFRNKLLERLRQSGVEKDQYAVASALILGYKDDLDKQTMQAYAGAGAMHVLAVSGLHVGVIYLVLMFLLAFLDKLKKGNIIKALLVIACLATYAMLTGLSPSVNRAVVMFSFITLAACFRRQTNVYNTLLLSALILAIINPYVIAKVGFQLSYMAVLGIVYLYPRLFVLLIAPNKLLNWLWQITCVSIAAQVATLPFSLYYFHQFPTYFLLFNPLVIAGATVVVCLGMGFFAFSWIPIVAKSLGHVIDYFVECLNLAVGFSGKLPFGLASNINLCLAEVILLYLIMAALLVWLAEKRVANLYWFLGFAFLFSAYQLKEAIDRGTQKSFTVYGIDGQSAFEFTSGKQNILFLSTGLMQEPDKIEKHIRPNWQLKGLKASEYLGLEKLAVINLPWLSVRDRIFEYEGKRLALVNGSKLPFLYDEGIAPIEVDYVLVCGDPILYMADIKKHFTFGKVIFDASNTDISVDRWVKECKETNIPYHNINSDGAFILGL